MKGLVLSCVLAAGACGYPALPSVGGGGSDGGTPDAGQPIDALVAIDASVVIDAPAMTIDGCLSFSTQLDTCALDVTTDVTIIGDRIYNTDTHVLADVGGSNEMTVPHARIAHGSDMLDAIVAKRFTLVAGARLHVLGSVAFGVVASDQLLIAGTLDAVGSSLIETAGARSRGDCGGAAGSNASNHNGGAPGGGGGGFRSTGGTGGQATATAGRPPAATAARSRRCRPGSRGAVARAATAATRARTRGAWPATVVVRSI